MHELSIAHAIVSAAAEAVSANPGARVRGVRLRLGRLGGVVEESLLFCWGIATAGTPAEGATLEITHVPVAVFCSSCQAIVELPGVQSFRCPRCQTPSGDIRAGRELEIESLEVEDSVDCAR